jgi:hypothetical protein
MNGKIDVFRIFIVCVFYLFSIGPLKAQNERIIRGKIVNEQQRPLTAIGFKVKNKSISTSTNQNGAYILSITNPNAAN